jgi:hypothetical protein
MLNWVLSLMVHKKLLTEDEAVHLGKELPLKTHPHNFLDAHKVVEDLLKDFRKNK